VAGHLTRKELKSDQVAVTVEHTVDYFQLHQQNIVKIVIGVVAVAVLAGGIMFYRSQQHATRQAALSEALRIANAPLGAQGTPDAPAFPSLETKVAEETKVLSKLMSDYSGSEEAYISEYYLASALVSDNKLDEARKHLQNVVDHASKSYASLAKLSLAQIDFQENRADEGEKLLRDLINNPTTLVSKDQATLSLAQAIAAKNPAEARKLLEPLAQASGRDVGEVAGAALRILNTLPK
jgi:predicted negative regulator of RcsB-dependent stress response